MMPGRPRSVALLLSVLGVVLAIAAWLALPPSPGEDAVPQHASGGPVVALPVPHPARELPTAVPSQPGPPTIPGIEWKPLEASTDGPQPDAGLPARPLPHVPRQGKDPAVRLYVPDSAFEERYRGSTLEQLFVARSELEQVVGGGVQAASNAWLDGGGGELLIWDPARGEDPPPHKGVPGLINVTRSQSLSNGLVQRQTGSLPWDQFTDLYDERDELFWLIGEVNRRSKGAAVQSGDVTAK